MKHNGNLQVSGKLASKKIIIGDFSGTTVTSGSYQLPYPIGDFKSVLSVSLDVSGNKFLEFTNIDASTLTYTPSAAGDWTVVPDTMSEGFDILANDLKNHTHLAETLKTNILDGTYILQPNGVGGVQWNPLGSSGLTDYYNKTQTNAISAYLQSEINVVNARVDEISANLGSATFTGLTDAPSSYAGHANEFLTVHPSETKLTYTSLLSGSLECNTTDQLYTVHNSKLTVNSTPIVSLTLPVSGETQYLASATNIRSAAFDVVVSGIPTVSGYRINWLSLNNI